MILVDHAICWSVYLVFVAVHGFPSLALFVTDHTEYIAPKYQDRNYLQIRLFDDFLELSCVYGYQSGRNYRTVGNFHRTTFLVLLSSARRHNGHNGFMHPLSGDSHLQQHEPSLHYFTRNRPTIFGSLTEVFIEKLILIFENSQFFHFIRSPIT